MLSALDLAHQIETGELSPAAVLERCAEAISAREAEIGAFAALDLERARQLAEARGTELSAQPLRGLAVGVKDIFDTAELPTSYGSAIYAGHRPKADAAVVSMVRRAGGIVLGKTVTAEFAHLDPGKTRNPRKPAHTPGGSSSGSAAAVAAGMLPIAIGTQTGGSVIRPASFCGVTGFKPSFATIPTVGAKTFAWHLDTVGLFAAGVADVAFSAEAITGWTAPRQARRGSDCCAGRPGRRQARRCSPRSNSRRARLKPRAQV
jgi:Asp-tRNA(Asn)/Glu-tRNA(Gln) amidotransferase A subunit family amidase